MPSLFCVSILCRFGGTPKLFTIHFSLFTHPIGGAPRWGQTISGLKTPSGTFAWGELRVLGEHLLDLTVGGFAAVAGNQELGLDALGCEHLLMLGGGAVGAAALMEIPGHIGHREAPLGKVLQAVPEQIIIIGLEVDLRTVRRKLAYSTCCLDGSAASSGVRYGARDCRN